MENFYDMTTVSKKTVDNAKRIEKQTADFIKEYDTNLRESLEAKEASKLEAAMSGARFGYAANCARSKNRVNSLNEELQYAMKAPVIGMTEMVATLVEEALPLDAGELAKIYPEYKEDIRDIISGFLTEADINKNITDETTLSLMEYVAKTLPDAKDGKNLTEDDLSNIIAANRPLNIDRSLKTLAGDVSSRVATLMEKEQKKVEDIERNVNKAVKKADKKVAEDTKETGETINKDELIAGLQSGEITEDDLNELLQNGDITQSTFDDVMKSFEPVESEEVSEDGEPVDQAPVPQEEGTPVAPADASMASTQDMSSSATPKKQIQMLPDGTLNVNIFENALVRETPRQGLIESLAVNEAMNMLAEGKEYDSDLCLAKAIMYVTITESMDALHLMKVDDIAYGKIINAAGGKCLTENRISKSDKLYNKYGPVKAADEVAGKKGYKGPIILGLFGPTLAGIIWAIIRHENNADASSESYRLQRLMEKDSECRRIISEINAEVKGAQNKAHLNNLKNELKNAIRDLKAKDISLKESDISFINSICHENINEGVLVSQYVPVINNRADGESLAEKIRRKRLLQESHQENLTE